MNCLQRERTPVWRGSDLEREMLYIIPTINIRLHSGAQVNYPIYSNSWWQVVWKRSWSIECMPSSVRRMSWQIICICICFLTCLLISCYSSFIFMPVKSEAHTESMSLYLITYIYCTVDIFIIHIYICTTACNNMCVWSTFLSFGLTKEEGTGGLV